MGLKITPIVFVAGTIAKSSDVNSNFTQIVNATDFSGAWDAVNNTSVSITNEDTTINNVPVMHLHPSNGNPDRGLMFSARKSGGYQNAFYIDTNGVCRFFNDSFDNHNNEIAGVSRFTGNGNGTYNHNYSGATPDFFAITATGSTPSDVSYQNAGSSTVQVYILNGGSFVALASLL